MSEEPRHTSLCWYDAISLGWKCAKSCEVLKVQGGFLL